MWRKHARFSAAQILALGFGGLILVGTALLMLPAASRSGEPLLFFDALFMSTSAACVTGLVLMDPFTQFTLFGQAVLLGLIQIGGLGFMTVLVMVALLLNRRIGLRQRAILVDGLGALQLGGIVRLTRRALLLTVLLEGGGSAVLSLWFCPRYGLWPGLWRALFHAVSAFCNAGFDLMGTGRSLAATAGEPLLNLTLTVLIAAGGLGFLVWDDILSHGLRFRSYRLHSKIVLTGTTLLLAAGTAGYYILEGDHSFAGASGAQRLLMAIFQSVTARTAGFSTVDISHLSAGGTLLTLVLMGVGAGSGSTGGGLKVNTVAVLALGAQAHARRKKDVNLFGRRLSEETMRSAADSASLYGMACLLGCMVLCVQGISLEDALFEAVSAIGTVGLSRGITGDLPGLSRLAVIGLMFLGRVGSMSVALALTRDLPEPRVRRVPERILVG